MFCFIIGIYSFNYFSCANKNVLSIQLTLHTSAGCLIFCTSPVSFVGLKTASSIINKVFYVFVIYLGMQSKWLSANIMHFWE